jgi:short-chain fatty acids transporter
MGMALSDWAERWFPDALVFAMLAIVVVFVAGLSVRSTVSDLVTDFGDGFWELVPFTIPGPILLDRGLLLAS